VVCYILTNQQIFHEYIFFIIDKNVFSGRSLEAPAQERGATASVIRKEKFLIMRRNAHGGIIDRIEEIYLYLVNFYQFQLSIK